MLFFDIEWLNGEQLPPPEISSTFGRFALRFQDDARRVFLTRHLEVRSDRVHDALYTSVYPLALYLAENWWSLLYEPFRDNGEQRFDKRHSFFFGARGFPYPDVRIYALEEIWISVSAQKKNFEFAGVDFLQELEEALVPRTAIESSLAAFISEVLERLGEDHISGTALHCRWQAITGLDRDESQFCEWAGRFGLDPFSISEGDGVKLHSAIERLADFEPSDIAGALCWPSIDDEIQRLEFLFEHARELSHKPAALLSRARDECSDFPESSPAYEQGQWIAGRLRDTLLIDRSKPENPGELLAKFEVSVQEEAFESLEASFKSVLYSNATIGGVLSKQTRTSQDRFIKARMLCEALLPGTRGKTVNDDHSWTQRRNRAFAAEMLAPATHLSKLVSASTISSEELQELAEELDVSTMLIEHQLENAKIAKVVWR